MNPSEAVKFLTEAAWKSHAVSPVSCNRFGPTGTLDDNRVCTCGAEIHNQKVKEALMTIGRAAKNRK